MIEQHKLESIELLNDYCIRLYENEGFEILYTICELYKDNIPKILNASSLDELVKIRLGYRYD